MRLSVILSTYNQPDWLEKVLLGYASQGFRDFDMVIADDGSTRETRERIDVFRKRTGLDITHVWQEDDGFRKSQILNKAIEAASADYLVVSDGDCIPRADFLAVHERLSVPGAFLSGGYVKLPMPTSLAIGPDEIQTGAAFDPTWLAARGMPWRRGYFKLRARRRSARVLDALTTTRPTWNGHNASGWKHDIVAVNGFDERMGYGGQDRELGERLENSGVRGRQVRHSAICVHLDHGRGYIDPEAWRRNHEIRRETRATGRSWTEWGIVRRDPPNRGTRSPAGTRSSPHS